MYRHFLMLAFAGILASCGASGGGSGSGGGDNPLDDGTECTRDNPLEDCEEPVEEETDPEEEEVEEGVPEELALNLESYTMTGNTLSVAFNGLDGTPNEAAYARNTNLDIYNQDNELVYKAFVRQEDSLDRFFLALGAVSADSSVSAVAVGDGGQFTQVQQGTGYLRADGEIFDAPDIGSGPGQGQVSYAGSYGGITNYSTEAGDELLPVSGTGQPDRPGQPVVVTGTIFLNVNFADATVNGEIYDRTMIDPDRDMDDNRGGTSPAAGDVSVEGVARLLTTIDENGEFFGEVDSDELIISGEYGGIFGGVDSRFVAGTTAFTWSGSAFSDVQEVGMFVLTQCGRQGDVDYICDNVAPD